MSVKLATEKWQWWFKRPHSPCEPTTCPPHQSQSSQQQQQHSTKIIQHSEDGGVPTSTSQTSARQSCARSLFSASIAVPQLLRPSQAPPPLPSCLEKGISDKRNDSTVHSRSENGPVIIAPAPKRKTLLAGGCNADLLAPTFPAVSPLVIASDGQSASLDFEDLYSSPEAFAPMTDSMSATSCGANCPDCPLKMECEARDELRSILCSPIQHIPSPIAYRGRHHKQRPHHHHHHSISRAIPHSLCPCSGPISSY